MWRSPIQPNFYKTTIFVNDGDRFLMSFYNGLQTKERINPVAGSAASLFRRLVPISFLIKEAKKSAIRNQQDLTDESSHREELRQ
ncbi:MAG TPA: hypothetical protein V6C71_16785 [Coleofasciculaceae cyanobacterium]|jgi:hypothetical protein